MTDQGKPQPQSASRADAFVRTLRHYYESNTPDGHRFRHALLTFDVVTIPAQGPLPLPHLWACSDTIRTPCTAKPAARS
jgi:hypothetical protein